jgi:hypothetical protein
VSDPNRMAIEAIREQCVRSLQRGLEAIGWQILSLEIDATTNRARIELRCGDRLVTFDAREGSATTTREIIERETVAIGRRGDRFRAERLKASLLGRDRHAGMRSGLRQLAAYIEQNAPKPALTGSVRELMRPMLSVAEVGHG